MAGFGVVDGIREVFPEVTAAVEQYQQARNDRHSRSLVRHIANEEAVFDQFVRKLSSLASSSRMYGASSMGTLQERLGSKNTAGLTSDLEELSAMLSDFKLDLEATSRGTEVLARVRTKSVFRSRGPISPLQKRLDAVSAKNKSLMFYLADSRLDLPLANDFRGSLECILLLHQPREERTEAFEVLGASYTCRCNLTAYRQLCSLGDDAWTSVDTSDGAPSVVSKVRRLRDNTKDLELLRKTRACLNVVDDKEPHFHHHFDPCTRGRRVLRLSVKETQRKPELIGFGELMKNPDLAPDMEKRLDLAFRLSTAVLLLWSSLWVREYPRGPKVWIKESTRWSRWGIYVPEDYDEDAPRIFLGPQSPMQETIKEHRASTAVFNFLSRDPVLARLGLRLTELALGRTLAELRQENPKILGLDEALGSGPDSLDLLTAKRLLLSGRLRQEVSKDYEDAVATCINQQFREPKGGQIKDLNFKDSSFLPNATVAILLPLYREMSKRFPCERDALRRSTPAKRGLDEDSLPDTSVPVSRNNMAGPDKTLLRTMFDDRPPPSSDFISGNASSVTYEGPAGHIKSPTARPQEQVTAFGGPVHEEDDDVDDDDDDDDADSCKSDDSPPRNTADMPSRTVARIEEEDEDEEDEESSDDEAVMLAGGKRVPGSSAIRSDLAGLQRIGIRPPPSDNAAYSEFTWSEESLTDITESAFDWPSERSSRMPRLEANHPFARFSGVGLRVLLKAFYAKEATCGTSEVSGSISRAGDFTKKRKNNQGGAGRGGGGPDDEEGETPQSPLVAVKEGKAKEGTNTFACPFLKKDTKVHLDCCRYTLRRIRDVKQHLKRSHSLPIYCPRCFKRFQDELARDEHAGRMDICERRPASEKPQGITTAQKQALSKKASSSLSPENQWYGIFETLFPGHQPRPDSPYVDTSLLQSMMNYQYFLLAEGPRIIANLLTNSGAVTWNLPHPERDMEAFQRRMLEEGIEQIFNQWTSRSAMAAAEADDRSAQAGSSSLISAQAAAQPSAQFTPSESSLAPTDPSNGARSEAGSEHQQHADMVAVSTPWVPNYPSSDAMSWNSTDLGAFANFNLGSDHGSVVDEMPTDEIRELINMNQSAWDPWLTRN